MRVGIDARKFADFGIGSYIRGLIGALVELQTGDEYVAFAPAGAPVPRGVEHVVIEAPHYSVRELFAVGRAADRAALDVFHAPHYVVPMTRVPIVVTVHDLIHLHQPLRNPLAPLYARTMIGRAVRRSARVLTVSETVKQEIAGTFHADSDRIIVTPNGIDVRFTPEGRRAAGRYFLFVGNDKPHKRVDMLIDAFAIVKRELPDVALVLAGSPFERFAEIAVTPGYVTNDDLAALYRGAIAVIVPSAEEGFGLPAAEAMRCGAAVITSSAPALVEVTRDAALHAGDARSLAGAMVRVANDATLRSSLAARGIARASAFTWKRCAELTSSAYRAAAGR